MQNRIIKFRAWSGKADTVGEPFTLQQAIGSRKLEGVDTTGILYEQFAGLLDKNGKEIYEGDIVEIDWGPEYGRYPVTWNADEAGFEFYPSTRFHQDGDEFGRIEVIGNIHENPDLLTAPVEAAPAEQEA